MIQHEYCVIVCATFDTSTANIEDFNNGNKSQLSWWSAQISGCRGQIVLGTLLKPSVGGVEGPGLNTDGYIV